MSIPFQLQPFTPLLSLEVQITGRIQRQGTQLRCEYELRGDWSRLVLPPPHNWPKRRDRLWTSTCFELFLAPHDSTNYWEINLAPDGDWNLYRFQDYRAGMSEESAIAQLSFTVKRELGWFQLVLSEDFSALFKADTCLDVGISCVLALRDRGESEAVQRSAALSYWALVHPGTAADFHDRAGFSLCL
jgi:hypothetical protein